MTLTMTLAITLAIALAIALVIVLGMPLKAHSKASVCLALYLLLHSAPAWGSEISELRRAIEALQAQNKALAQRITQLEAGKAAPAGAGSSAAVAAAMAHEAAGPAGPAGSADEAEDLLRRVKLLEMSRIAQEDATRAIIRNAVSTLGSRINEAVSLSGVVDVLASRTSDFSGQSNRALKFNGAELDFDIRLNPWAKASLIMAYNDGSSALSPSAGNVSGGGSRAAGSGVDRFTADSASITIGDVQRFPFYLQAGKVNLGFGSSTGSHRADVLSIEDPLTVAGFETRREAVTFGFAFPTPRPIRAAAPVPVPQARPQLIAPAAAALGRALGFVAIPRRPAAPAPVDIAPDAPPFYGSLSFYDNRDSARRFGSNINARLGLRSGGHCGKPYSELGRAHFCPWALDVSVDTLSSVFDSRFLSSEYLPFLNQFGRVRGLASTLKLSFGPMQLTGEWNGATRRAKFIDDAGVQWDLKPSAWQAALGYQFDWNPWLRAVGEQGSWLSLGYSHTRDFAGATQVIGGESLRVGNLARSRWSLTYGEWVLEGLKLQLEYSRSKDYERHAGGTGATAQGFQASMSYNW